MRKAACTFTKDTPRRHAPRGCECWRAQASNVLGPQYETPAEVRMVRQLGADAIGMSTVLEAIQAHALGVEVVAAFSCLTNWAAGLGSDHPDHADVLEASGTAAAEFARLLSAAL